jgi:hypothetical protein
MQENVLLKRPPLLGAKIANSRAVPGTLGCIVRSRTDGQPLLLTSWHVLFGKGARKNDPVWLVEEDQEKRNYLEAGRAQHGHIGSIPFGGDQHYLDCGVASFLFSSETIRDFHALEEIQQFSLLEQPGVWQGYEVSKTGAATGTTKGVVIDVKYSTASGGGVSSGAVQQQILIRPTGGSPVFCAEGDSGALITGVDGRAVGLLWGSTSRGEGVACHIAPVFFALNIV